MLRGVSSDPGAVDKNGWLRNSISRIGAARRREGSSRQSKKDYLHFLYIARGSLSETQYFIHLSQRLGYLLEGERRDLIGQTRQTFACLHGLIKAVEKESGKFAKAVALLTSLLVLGLWSRSPVVP
ncbi:MAG: four helix bundle protein [Planctomycetes bacterium]|nr:four helix bundle protein [Planctomycetota bacterium]